METINNLNEIENDADNEMENEIEFDQYGMPIEHIDEEEENQLIEMRNLTLKKQSNSFANYEPTNRKDQTNKKINKKNAISLGDLHKLIDQKLMNSKSKKFISHRVQEKTGVTSSNINKIENTRKFNPRCIPYNFRSI